MTHCLKAQKIVTRNLKTRALFLSTSFKLILLRWEGLTCWFYSTWDVKWKEVMSYQIGPADDWLKIQSLFKYTKRFMNQPNKVRFLKKNWLQLTLRLYYCNNIAKKHLQNYWNGGKNNTNFCYCFTISMTRNCNEVCLIAEWRQERI